jgi:hypothetical protein
MRGKLYTARLEICLTEGQKKRIELSARKKRITINQAIRDLIERFC